MKQSSFRYSGSGRLRQQKIVIFDKGVDRADWVEILSGCRGYVVRELPLVNGLVVLVDEDEAADVQSLASSRSGVLRVDDDIDINLDLIFNLDEDPDEEGYDEDLDDDEDDIDLYGDDEEETDDDEDDEAYEEERDF